jgi:hypothetical protein
MIRRLIRRQVLLPLVAVLVLTAPLSAPTYSACVLLANHVATFPAHLAFRWYQQNSDKGRPTVFNTLVYMLSLLIHLEESNAAGILVMRLLNEEASLAWFLDQPEVACLVFFPRLLIKSGVKETDCRDLP